MKSYSRINAIKDTAREANQFRIRAIIGFTLIVLASSALVARFYHLQVQRHDEFSTRSEANRIRLHWLAPARGLIYDRNGMLLADNVPAYRLEVVPEHAGKLDLMLEELGAIVPLSDDDLEHFRQLVAGTPKYDSIPLRLHLSEDEVARFAINRYHFPGVDVVPYLTRRYPLANEFSHLVGYVGRIDLADKAQLDPGRYAVTTLVGKVGIERYYEDMLHGEPGYERVESNADGRALRVLDRIAPTPGKNLYLSIDARLQQVADDAFVGRTGAAVAVDPRNGEVLAMVSVPGFDPNLFVNGIGHSDYNALLNAPEKPLLNRAVSGNFTPGSTVKPFVAMAGLGLGIRKATDTVFSTGEFHIAGQQRAYRDDLRGGHGRVDVIEAIARSVNTYFYSLAQDMGIDRFADYLVQFGFGEKTGIDLPTESRGVLPSRDWKMATHGKVWYPGETVIAGIGQGYWVITPVQLANALAILAGKGERRQIHLLHATQDGFGLPQVLQPIPAAQPSFIKPADWNAVAQGMIAVVNGDGTARGLGDGFPYVIAGKTGTAERYSRTTEAWQNIMETAVDRHQVLFEAFTPAESARIAVVVALEAGHTGASDAAPIARKMLDSWLTTDAAAGLGVLK